MQILFITATRLGDAVLSTGLLDHLLRTHPEARFTIACGPVAEGVFARMPRRVRTIVMNKRRFDLHWIGLWRQTVGTAWDLVVDLRGSAVAFLVYARKRVILQGGRRPPHKIDQLAAAMGIVPSPLPASWTAPQDVAAAARLLPGAAPLIALGPTANWSGKVWPASRFVALFQAIQAQLPGAVPVIFAGPGEAERVMAAPVLDALPGAIDLGGRLTLPEASACLARCALFVGNDSGLMHLAAAAGTPTLGLFGPTPAREYAPAGRSTAVVTAQGEDGGAPIEGLAVGPAIEAALGLLGKPLPLPTDTAAILHLNNLHQEALSALDPARLAHLAGQAFYARQIGDAAAFLIALDETADYDSPNFRWFRERYARFVYLDRVVVAAHARGRGHAKALHADLLRHAALAGHTMIALEINAEPPNPASDALHAALGFAEVGRAVIHGGAKTVRYCIRAVPRAAA